MKLKKFFKKLDEYYSPDFDGNGNWYGKLGVKYYMEATSFSYEIYTQEEAYTGRPIFESDVFSFPLSYTDEIISNIKWNLKRLK